jgi:hypothetical protein
VYVEAEEVRDIATQMTETAISDNVLEALILRASRMFDLACGVEPEYFEAAVVDESTIATDLIIYGDGTNYLKLPPYVPGSLADTVTVPTGYTAPTFIVKNGYLIRAESDVLRTPYTIGWYDGVPITVSAIWGYETTPEDVKASVIELVINLWRETDPAFLKITNLEGQAVREKLPPRVKYVANQYRVRQGVFV